MDISKLSVSLHHQTKTKNIMNTTNIKTSEEFKSIVTIYLKNGHTISIPTETLMAHIEEYELNLTDFTGGEIYPAVSASDWMDINENFDQAVESYYTNVICK